MSDIGDYLVNPTPKNWEKVKTDCQDQLVSLKNLSTLLSGEEQQLGVAVPEMLRAISMKGHLVVGIDQLTMPTDVSELKELRDKLSGQISALKSADEELRKYIKAGGENLPECAGWAG